MARAERIWLLSAAAAFLYLASRKSRWPQSMPCWRVWLPADLGFFLGVYLIAATASELSLAPGGLGRKPRRLALFLPIAYLFLFARSQWRSWV